MENEIVVSKLDYSRLNRMILNLLEKSGSNLYDLNRLNMEIKRARLVDPRRIDPEGVTMNSVVRLRFRRTGLTTIVKLVYPPDAGTEPGYISVLSPLGCALLGYRKGQSFPYKSPEGVETAVIDKILYQPEANGRDLD